MPRLRFTSAIVLALGFAAAAPHHSAAGVQPCAESFSFIDFFDNSALTLVGGAYVSGNSTIHLTEAGDVGGSGAFWYTDSKVNLINGFDVTFTFQISAGVADGIAFVIQNDSPNAIGSSGSDLGYAGIPSSLAVEIDTFSFGSPFELEAVHISVQSDGIDPNSSDDIYSWGAVTLDPSTYDPSEGNSYQVRITYDAVNYTMSVYFNDLNFPQLVTNVNLGDFVGENILDNNGCAWIGFTGANGGATADQEIIDWSFNAGFDACTTGFGFPDFESTAQLSLVGAAQQLPSPDRIRLTNTSTDQPGALWYSQSKASLSDGFSVDFTFQITDGQGDGFAFVIQNESDTAIGDGGSGIGYANNGIAGITSSLAVEFDTFGFKDEAATPHISIQTRGLSQNEFADSASLGLVVLDPQVVDILDGQPHTVRINYNGSTLEVFLDDLNIPILSVPVDLQNINGESVLNENGCAWIGFTSGNGAARANHDILSFYLNDAFGGCTPLGVASFQYPFFGVTPPNGFDLIVDLTGSPANNIQWFKDGNPLSDGGNISGATTAHLTVSPTTTNDSGNYVLHADNNCSGIQIGVPITVAPTCPGDADGDGDVDFSDITTVLANFNNNYLPGSGLGDADFNGVVNFSDITTVLANFATNCNVPI